MATPLKEGGGGGKKGALEIVNFKVVLNFNDDTYIMFSWALPAFYKGQEKCKQGKSDRRRKGESEN